MNGKYSLSASSLWPESTDLSFCCHSISLSIAQDEPPAITHSEFYYGFVGFAMTWQVAFLIIRRDPKRYRPLMPSWKS
jgi:hypothetical protein